MRRVFLIAGPTAAGKSSLALDLAKALSEVGKTPLIVNADSMQVYRELRVVTARPNEVEEALCRHYLFGFVSALQPFSTGVWLKHVDNVFASLRETDIPIFVGGTGLYFNALTDGLSEIPEIPEHIRTRYRSDLHEKGAGKLHRELRRLDPMLAERLKPADGQRIARALEVLAATGKSVRWWQSEGRQAGRLDEMQVTKCVVLPPREKLYERVDQRFDAMMASGAIKEVAAFMKLSPAPDLPAMKAIGVPQLSAYLSGTLSLDEAVDQAKRESRRYAKRQMTWFRNQMADWPVIEDPSHADMTDFTST